MAGKIIQEKQQPECGKAVGKPCSELFVEIYDSEKIKLIVLRYYEELLTIFPDVFSEWEKDKKTGEIDFKFLEKYSQDLLKYIKDELIKDEERVSDFLSYDIECTIINQYILKFLSKNSNNLIKIRKYIQTGEYGNKIECGKSAGILCSELFSKTYRIDRLKAMILVIYRKKKNEWKSVFESWPIDKYGFIEDNFLRHQAEGLFEQIKNEILTSESNNPEYELYNFHFMIFRKMRSFLKKESTQVDRPRQLTVNEDLLRMLQCLLNISVTHSSIEHLVKKFDTESSKRLQEELHKIPGLSKARFKIRNGRAYMYLTESDFLIFFKYIMKGRTKTSGIRASKISTSETNSKYVQLNNEKELRFG